MSWRVESRIVATGRLVASVLQRALAVSQAVSLVHVVVSQAPSGHDIKNVSRPNSCRTPCHARCRACRSAVSPPACRDTKLYRDTEAPTAHIARRVVARTLSCHRSCCALYCDLKGCPHPRYNFCITTHPMPCPRELPHASRVG